MTAAINNNGGSQFDIVIGGVVAASITAGGISKVQDASITAAKLATAVQPIGVGQTWQLVTRSHSVTYTNSTGRPILGVRANLGTSNALQTMLLSINSGPNMTVAIGAYSGTALRTDAVGHYLIPDGATYLFTDTQVGTITTYELR
jgi:hypothetical protein